MKKIFLLWVFTCALVLVLLGFFVKLDFAKEYSTVDYPVPSRSEINGRYVHDWVGLLDKEDWIAVNGFMKDVSENGKGNIHVVIVEVSDPENCDKFATKIAQLWDGGSKRDVTNTVIILASPRLSKASGSVTLEFAVISGNSAVGYADDPDLEKMGQSFSSEPDLVGVLLRLGEFIKERQEGPLEKDGFKLEGDSSVT